VVIASSLRQRGEPSSWLGSLSLRGADARRDDQHRAAGDADEAIRDAAEKRGLEPPTPTRADDDQFGSLVICQIGESLSREPEGYALFGVAKSHRDRYPFQEPRTSFLLVFGQQRDHRSRRNSTGSTDRGVRHQCDFDHMRENKPRSKPFCQPRRYANGDLRVGRPIDTTND
jgi:hypothetical protein